MARTLQEQATSYQRSSLDGYGGARSPQPPYNQAPVPGFAIPNGRGPSPAPPGWNPWSAGNTPAPQGYPSPYPGPSYTPQPPPVSQADVISSIAALSLGPQPQDYSARPRTSSVSANTYGQHYSQQPAPPLPQQSPPPPQPQQYFRQPSAPLPSSAPPQIPSQTNITSGPPSLTAPLPTIAGLASLLPSIRQPDYDPIQKVAWCRDVFALVARAENAQLGATKNPTAVAADLAGPVRIGDPQLQRLIDVAVPLVQTLSSPNPMPKPVPIHIAEAIYLKAMCESSGAYPQYIKRDPRTAFRNFEYAARHGYSAAWFKIGRDYENFEDIAHARDAFERGVRARNEHCLYVSPV